MKYLISIIFVSVCLSVDILSVGYPASAKSLSSIGYGVAFNKNHSVNPASLSENNQTYFEFSNNKWIFDIEGSSLSYIDNNIRLSGYYWRFRRDTPFWGASYN